LTGQADLPPNFDIVNGFLNRCRGGIVVKVRTLGAVICAIDIITRSIKMIIWLRYSSMPSVSDQALCRLVVDGVDLKREVRAFGGCLGMYRRRRTWHAAISVGEL
jgi:hypothetical protein